MAVDEKVDKSDEESRKVMWEREVRFTTQNCCSNCGSTDRLRVRMIVPLEVGGLMVRSNGVVLCRTCDMARDMIARGSSDNRWPINFWVSRSLYDRLQHTIKTKNGFKSMSSLVRYLMSKYVADQQAFDDLEQYQESGNEVKLNVWVEKDRYETFHAMLRQRGMTVTDGLKALIRMFDAEAAAVSRRK